MVTIAISVQAGITFPVNVIFSITSYFDKEGLSGKSI